MNFKILFISILSAFILLACFDDEGNYEYIELNAPTFDMTASPYVIGYANSNNVKGTFKFHYEQADSANLMANTIIEWVVNDHVVCTEKTIDLPVDTVMHRAEIEKFGSYYGYVSIKNKETGMEFMHKMTFYLRPKFWKSGWLILSDYNGGSKLSFQRWYYLREDGKVVYHYENYDNIFEEMNPGVTLKGKPVRLRDHSAKYINPLLGATAVFTTKEAYDVDNENFTVGRDFKNEFLDAAPDCYFKDIFYKDKNSYMIGSNGKLYFRKFSANWLGGKFISQPYIFDGKDSHVSLMAGGLSTARVKHFYDAKNRRLLCLSKDYDLNVVETSPTINYPIDLTNLEEGCDVVCIANKQESIKGSVPSLSDLCVIVYKKDGKVRITEFVTDAWYTNLVTGDKFVDYEAPIQLDDESIIWMPTVLGSYGGGDKNKYAIFYTHGNEFRRYNRKTGEDVVIWTAEHKITACRWFGYFTKPRIYNYLAVGTENGDFYLVETDLPTPKIVDDTEFNVGGAVRDVSCMGSTVYY